MLHQVLFCSLLGRRSIYQVLLYVSFGLSFVPVSKFVYVGFNGVSADFVLGIKVSTIK